MKKVLCSCDVNLSTSSETNNNTFVRESVALLENLYEQTNHQSIYGISIKTALAHVELFTEQIFYCIMHPS